jgi:hypothetical protein
MKKYSALCCALLALFFVSCESATDPGGTAIEKMAGDWWVTVDLADSNGDVVAEDPYGIGHFQMFTYNTAANLPTEMWLEDGGHFWDYKLKVSVNYEARTFSTSDFVENVSYESKVKITAGKVVEGGTTTPSDMPADYIEYLVQFDDDGEDGAVIFKIHGFRRTGFPADDF